MPGRLFLTMDIAAVASELGVDAATVADEPTRANIAPGQHVVTYAEVGLSRMRWGIIPVGRVNARGRPVMETLINTRCETVFEKSAFEGMGRAVVPASGWYEWTGAKQHKTAWAITPLDAPLLWFAAVTDVWTAPGGLRVPQVATVTCPPNADVAPIHHRMGVLLERDDIETWLSGTQEQAKALMHPWPGGRLRVQEAKGIDWAGP